MNTPIEIPKIDIEEIMTFFNKLLAEEYALYSKTRNTHWNVNIPNFYELHKFFENQYEVLVEIIEDIIDWVRSLGHFALDSMKDLWSISSKNNEYYNFCNSTQIIQALVKDHEELIHTIQNEIAPLSDKCNDPDTTDFAKGLICKHEKMSRMLKAFLC